MENVNIDFLKESELGVLTGGFTVVEGENVSETSFHNGNCATESGWFNDNCGCKACGLSQPTIPHD